MSMIRSLAQVCLSGIFILGGANAFLTPGYRVKAVEKVGIPQPEPAVTLSGAAMVIGGTMLALNIAPKLAAIMLIGVLIPTTIVGHAFWNEKDEQASRNQLTHFLKNLGLIGGLLLVLSQRKR